MPRVGPRFFLHPRLLERVPVRLTQPLFTSPRPKSDIHYCVTIPCAAIVSQLELRSMDIAAGV
jgi:hypothetical protein